MSTKRKPPTKIAAPVVKSSAKLPFKSRVDESETAVSSADALLNGDAAAEGNVIEISSADESSEYDFTDDEKDAPEQQPTPAAEDDERPAKSKKLNESLTQNDDADVDMASPNDLESDAESTSPTFGDLVRANETIDVPSAFAPQQPMSIAAPGRSLAPPSIASFGTVLTQALRTDDTDLLESCLHIEDTNSIRSTIQRLDSSLAGVLLSKLAARMHRRPGRAGSLMAWVQWTLISHGGALSSQPGLSKKLMELNKVLDERARGLQGLLLLKGKLDLLTSQMELRRAMQGEPQQFDDRDEDEEGIVYVEGGEEDDELEVTNGIDDDDELPVTNGVVDDSEEEDEYSEDDDDEDEELEGVEEPVDENEVNFEDVDSAGEDEESDDAAPPPSKIQKTGSKGSKRR